MARARNIKPSFYKDQELADASIEARYLFTGLWGLADKDGLLEEKPRQIKVEVFPYDSIDVAPLLDQLERCKVITRYEVNGIKCIYIKGFVKHQRPHHREPSSGLPMPPEQARTSPGFSRPITAQPELVPASCAEYGMMNDEVLNDEPPLPQAGEVSKDSSNIELVILPPRIKPQANSGLQALPHTLDVEPFKSYWHDTWLPYLREKDRHGRDPPNSTQSEQLVFLSTFGPVSAVEVLKTSVRHGWISVHPPKDEQAKSNKKKPPKPDEIPF